MSTPDNQPVQLDALDRIALEASSEEVEAAAAENAILNPEKPQVMDPALAWAQIPRMFGGLLAMAIPEVIHVYTEDACMNWGGAMAQVSDKYGWDAADTMAKWGPEIALGMASLPLVVPTFQLIQKKRAEAAKNEPKSIDEQQQAPIEDGAVPKDMPETGGFSEPS